MFQEEVEPDDQVLNPEETREAPDTSAQHRADLLCVEYAQRDAPPPTLDRHVSHKGAMVIP